MDNDLFEIASRIRDEPLSTTTSATNGRVEKRPFTLLITGANSGIGLAAARILLLLSSSSSSSFQLLLVCRTQEKANNAREDALQILEPHVRPRFQDSVIPLACDQTSFASVHHLAHQLIQQHAPIDVLCLNSAILMPSDQLHPHYTVPDGCETTLQTNTLSPFLLLHLLADHVTQRIVLTTSGLHQHIELHVDDEQPYHYKKAYAQSKLYLVALCAELRRCNSVPSTVTVSCFSPGLVPDTGLFRTNQALLKNNHQYPVPTRSVAWGGGALVYMAIAQATYNCTLPMYWSTLPAVQHATDYSQHFTSVSIQDRLTETQRQQVWDLCCRMTGVGSRRVESDEKKEDDNRGLQLVG